jgi:hypothetical protein
VATIQIPSSATAPVELLDRQPGGSMTSEEDKASPWTKEKAAKFKE